MFSAYNEVDKQLAGFVLFGDLWYNNLTPKRRPMSQNANEVHHSFENQHIRFEFEPKNPLSSFLSDIIEIQFCKENKKESWSICYEL